MIILAAFGALLCILVFPTLFYYLWMAKKGKESWHIALKDDYFPMVTLIVATFNEVSIIGKKLDDIKAIQYPSEKLQVIVVDSASTDGTLNVCEDFLKNNSLSFPVMLVSESQRLGKSHALNTALKTAVGEIIATSDADSFWEPDALHKAISFLADDSIGAITFREELANLDKSVHTLSEGLYRKFYYTLRMGESKIHSTLIFQGESLYRRAAFRKFEDRAGYSDDTGTVINMISEGYRCIFVQEAKFYDTAAFSLSGRLSLKSRRAQHVVAGLMQALRYKMGGKLPLSRKIVFFNLHLHIISPLLLVPIAVLGGVSLALYFDRLWFTIPIALFFLLFKRVRLFILSYLTSNIALILGLFHHLTGRRESTWRKIDEMRNRDG